MKDKKTGGRKKGVPNKMTTDLRAAIQQAFADAGGADYLSRVAKSDPAVFCRLLGMTLPKDVHISGSLTLEDLLQQARDKRVEQSAVTH